MSFVKSTKRQELHPSRIAQVYAHGFLELVTKYKEMDNLKTFAVVYFKTDYRLKRIEKPLFRRVNYHQPTFEFNYILNFCIKIYPFVFVLMRIF